MFFDKTPVLYYLAFPNDRAFIKCLVYGIYILEFIQSVLIVEKGFWIFVTSFGDIEAIDLVGTTWLSVPILTAIGKLSCARHGRLKFLHPAKKQQSSRDFICIGSVFWPDRRKSWERLL